MKGISLHLQSVEIRDWLCDKLQIWHHEPYMEAVRLFHDKTLLPDGSIVEMTIWRLPGTDSERPHGLTYSLFYGRAGLRIVAYDNERGKGDHKHIEGRELSYQYISVKQLMVDFLTDVRRVRVRESNRRSKQ